MWSAIWAVLHPERFFYTTVSYNYGISSIGHTVKSKFVITRRYSVNRSFSFFSEKSPVIYSSFGKFFYRRQYYI